MKLLTVATAAAAVLGTSGTSARNDTACAACDSLFPPENSFQNCADEKSKWDAGFACQNENCVEKDYSRGISSGVCFYVQLFAYNAAQCMGENDVCLSAASEVKLGSCDVTSCDAELADLADCDSGGIAKADAYMKCYKDCLEEPFNNDPKTYSQGFYTGICYSAFGAIDNDKCGESNPDVKAVCENYGTSSSSSIASLSPVVLAAIGISLFR